jgi:hypothetical protein
MALSHTFVFPQPASQTLDTRIGDNTDSEGFSDIVPHGESIVLPHAVYFIPAIVYQRLG